MPLPSPWLALPLDRSPLPSAEPWGRTCGGAGAGGPEPSPALRPSGCWEARRPAEDIQVTVFEVHTLQRGSLHFHNGILEWQILTGVEAQEVTACSHALAGLHAICSKPPWDRQKPCLSCTPGSAANSENLYYENGVFRDHLPSPRQVHIDQGNPKRGLACSASSLLHPLQETCSCASVSLMSFFSLKYESVPSCPCAAHRE